MNINLSELRKFRLLYEDSKSELTEACKNIIDYAKFLGCEQKEGKEDVRISLAYIEGFLRCLEINRSKNEKVH